MSYFMCIFTLINVFSSLIFSISAINPTIAQTFPHMTIMVSRDSTVRYGFQSIQSAIDYIPPNNQVWTTVHVKAGYYREQVRIPRNKPFIHIKGEGKFTTFIISEANGPINESAAFTSEADFTLAQDITFTNAYNSHHLHKMTQAVAARIQGDKSVFYRCGFFSLQDTLWDVEGRHYFKECTIHGAVDYIFGAGQSLYQSCTISVAALDGGAGYITAQARGDPRDKSGFVFNHCKIIGKGKAYLGRPWRDHARVLFFNTFMSDAVVPQGWDSWGKPHNIVKQLSLGEYSCSGPGADMSKRVTWTKKMSEEEAKQLATISFIDDQGWLTQPLTILGA